MAEIENTPRPPRRPSPTPRVGRHRLVEVPEPDETGAEIGAEIEQGPGSHEVAGGEVVVPAVPNPPAAVGRTGHLAAFGALAATLAVQVAQGLVSVPPEAAQGISAPIWHAALTVAQVVLVVAAAYGMRPGQPQ
jgi:hypothetical protein